MTCILDILMCLSVSGFSVLRSNPRLCMWGQYSTTELHSQPPSLFWINIILLMFSVKNFTNMICKYSFVTFFLLCIIYCLCFIFYYGEMSCIAQIGVQLEDKLELLSLLPPPPEYLNCRHVPPHHAHICCCCIIPDFNCYYL